MYLFLSVSSAKDKEISGVFAYSKNTLDLSVRESESSFFQGLSDQSFPSVTFSPLPSQLKPFRQK